MQGFFRQVIPIAALAAPLLLSNAGNAFATCTIDPDKVSRSGTSRVLGQAGAACAITQSTVLDNWCDNVTDIGVSAGHCMAEHKRMLFVLHPSFGYGYCSIRSNLKNQSIHCSFDDFGIVDEDW